MMLDMYILDMFKDNIEIYKEFVLLREIQIRMWFDQYKFFRGM